MRSLIVPSTKKVRVRKNKRGFKIFPFKKNVRVRKNKRLFNLPLTTNLRVRKNVRVDKIVRNIKTNALIKSHP